MGTPTFAQVINVEYQVGYVSLEYNARPFSVSIFYTVYQRG